MAERKKPIEVTHKKLNIVFNLHSYVPEQMSGAEVMAHRMAKYLVQKGHDVTVISCWTDKIFEGVKVVNRVNAHMIPSHIKEIWEKADVVLSHLGQNGDSCNKCSQFRKPLVHIIHNTFDEIFIRAKAINSYVVYNSEWSKNVLNYAQPSIILNPPTDYREFADVNRKKADKVTLVNLNTNKGGKILIRIAREMPEYKFLGVEGGYDHQNKDEEQKNITYLPQQPDIKKALKQTRILLVPSEYESWGLIAAEAISCGIPVIANPTPGLQACLGDAGIYVKRSEFDQTEWIEAIKALDDPKVYKEASEKALARAKELDPVPQLERFEQFVQWVAKQPYQY